MSITPGPTEVFPKNPHLLLKTIEGGALTTMVSKDAPWKHVESCSLRGCLVAQGETQGFPLEWKEMFPTPFALLLVLWQKQQQIVFLKLWRKFFDMNAQTIGLTQLLKQDMRSNVCLRCFLHPVLKSSTMSKAFSRFSTVTGTQQMAKRTTIMTSILMT